MCPMSFPSDKENQILSTCDLSKIRVGIGKLPFPPQALFDIGVHLLHRLRQV